MTVAGGMATFRSLSSATQSAALGAEHGKPKWRNRYDPALHHRVRGCPCGNISRFLPWRRYRRDARLRRLCRGSVGGAMSAAQFTPGPRDLEVLADLIGAYDSKAKWADEVNEGVAPLDCGGMDGSDHSYRLSKLAKHGLAEQRYRGLGWGERPRRSIWRGSKLYRPTAAGRALIAKASGQ